MKLQMRILAVAAACCAMASALAYGPGFGQREKFNSDWRFVLADDSLASRPDYDDSKWRQLSLPHDWQVEQHLSPSMPSCQGYLGGGIGWYRKTFTVPDDMPKHYVYFEGIYNRSDVYLNGHLLGHRPSGYASIMYDLTPYLQPGENVLAVRVDHSRNADSRWYTGSGIYRDVYMVSAPETHLSQWGIGYDAQVGKGGQARVNVDVSVDNPQRGSSLAASLIDADGKRVASARAKVGADGKCVLPINVKAARLWDIDDPYLYTLRVELLDGKKVVDSDTVRVGIRTLEFDPNTGFSLNGVNRKVKGVCVHHDAGVLGAVVPKEVWRRRLTNLKSMGANAVRMAHNPQNPDLYDLCDEMGLLVMDEASDEWEFPKRKWVEGWNQGTPAYEGTYDFFEEWIDRDVADMVRRDRNHPSIFLWSIGNEVDYPNDPYSHPILDGAEINQPMYGGYKPEQPAAERIGKIAKRLTAVVKSIDTTRPVTGAMAGVIMSNQTEYPDAIDVCGYNYTENRYAEDHATYPDRVIYGSENGVGFDAWKAVRDNDYIFGQFVWTGLDYLGESGRWPSRGLGTGLLSFTGELKPRGHFRRSLWADEPVCYLGAYPNMQPRYGNRGNRPMRDFVSADAPSIWSGYDEGQPIRLVCYTNGASAELFINGESMGRKDKNDDNGIIHWDTRYRPGTAKAVAYDADGNAIAEYSIATTGRPYALRARIDGHDAAAGALNHMVIEVVDEDGNVVDLADNNITCRVEGSAKLLGLETANNSDMSDYKSPQRRAYQGKAMAYIVNDAEPGPVTITLTSPLLEKAVLEYTVK